MYAALAQETASFHRYARLLGYSIGKTQMCALQIVCVLQMLSLVIGLAYSFFERKPVVLQLPI